MVKRGEVYWVNLDPTVGSEVKKNRPAVVVSPDEMNRALRTVIVAPLTHTIKLYPCRENVVLNGDQGQIMLDQMRAVDKIRLGEKIGKLDVAGALTILRTMFSQ